MQKKLYFLNDEEKNRILNLHESRTKKQYLIENVRAVNTYVGDHITKRDSDMETINYECKSNMYPNVRDDFDADFYVQQIRRLSTNWTFHIGPEDSAALKNIFEKQIKTPDEYCAINEKYNEKHKRNISFDVNYAFYKDNAWKESFFNPIETLFKKGSEQPKGVEAANVAKPKETQGLTVQSLMKQAKDKTLAGKSTQDTSSSAGGGITNKAVQGIGTATRSVSSQIPTLLQQAGVEGTSLNQDTINKLYDKLSKKA